MVMRAILSHRPKIINSQALSLTHGLVSLLDNAGGCDKRTVTYTAKVSGLGGRCSGESSPGDRNPSEFNLSLGIWQ